MGESNKKRCICGSFYDGSMNDKCPYCGEKRLYGEESASSKQSKKWSPKKLFGNTSSTMKRGEEVGIIPKTSTRSQSRELFGSGSFGYQNPGPTMPLSGMSQMDNVEKTKPLSGYEDKPRTNEYVPPIAAPKTEGGALSFGQSVTPSVSPISTAPVQPIAQPEKKAYANLDSVKTVSKYATDDGHEPVVGWLVCTSGINKGRSFELKTGQNTVGRDSSNYVAIAREATISREKHAVIIFEPKKAKFYIQNGDSSGLTYHNDELVLSNAELLPYDKIQLGEAEFVLVPFCGEQFSWEK